MFYGKGIVPVYNEATQAKLRGFENAMLDMVKYQNWTYEQVAEFRRNHSPYIEPSDLVDYTWQGTFPYEKDITYTNEETSLPMIVQLGNDMTRLIALELSKLANIPYHKPTATESKYVFPHGGTTSSGVEILSVVFYAAGNAQYSYEMSIHLHTQKPELQPHQYGNFVGEKDMDGWRNEIVFETWCIAPLHLNYFHANEYAPERGIVRASVLHSYIRTVALHIFDRYYLLRKVG